MAKRRAKPKAATPKTARAIKPPGAKVPARNKKAPKRGKATTKPAKAKPKRNNSGTKRKLGRPSKYSKDLANKICRLLSAGHTLTEICSATGMPHRVTVLRWMDSHPDFRSAYARARDAHADALADEALQVARASKNDTAQADRVRIDTLKWAAGKFRPRIYGDRVAAEISGPDGGPIETSVAPDLKAMSDEQLEKYIAALKKHKST